MLPMMLHALRRDAQHVHQFMVVAIDEIAIQVQHVAHAAGQAGAEIQTGPAEDRHDAAGHVFATVIAHSLDDRSGAGVAHREALAGAAGGEQLAAGGAVQAGVAHDWRVRGDAGGSAGRAQHQASAGHALADVIVGITLQLQVQAAGVPGTEALPGHAGEAGQDRRVSHAGVAVHPGDFAGNPRADAAVAVADRIVEFTT